MFVLRKIIPLAERQITFSSRLLFPHQKRPEKKQEYRGFFSSVLKTDPPPPPKRPLTAYLVFCKENRSIILKENPSLSASEQTKVLAEKWNCLSPASRKVYEDVARKSVISYAEAHKKYYESLSEEQRQSLLKLKIQKKEAREHLRMKRLLKDSEIPKSPKSAYTLFLQAEAKEKNIVSLPEFNKEVAALWRNLPEDKKQLFVDQAKQGKELYESQMKAWREKLAKEGKQDLLQAYDRSKLKGKGSVSENASAKRMKKKDVLNE